MKITDKFVLRDKVVEQSLRDLEELIDSMAESPMLKKEHYIRIQVYNLDLMLKLFKQLENNVTPAKTLLDYKKGEIRDACNRVGECKSFADDVEFVVAVLQVMTR